jgi:hypothetical protein
MNSKVFKKNPSVFIREEFLKIYLSPSYLKSPPLFAFKVTFINPALQV